MRFGAHQSTAGGYDKAAERVAQIGGNALQLFSSSPRGWKTGEPTDAECEKLHSLCAHHDIHPVYFHASYLVNLAGKSAIQEKSRDALIAELRIASRCGVRGSIVHLGSFVGESKQDQGNGLTRVKYEGLLHNIELILRDTPDDTTLIIENMGVRKIGRTMEEIGFIIRELASNRVRVCLDTCHLHAAGYDVSDTEKLTAFLDSFDREIGVDRLDVWHINDSRDPFGSLRDRHENIGEGYVGDGVFRTIVTHPDTRELPAIIETPGFDGGGPDQKNLVRLKAYTEQ